MKREQKEVLRRSCREVYKNMVLETHVDPSPKDFTIAWGTAFPSIIEKAGFEGFDEDYVEWKRLYKNITELRIAALNEYPDLKEATLNESTFSSPEYVEKLEEEIKKHSKFVVSTVVAGKPANVEFFKSLQTYARANDALLLLLPIQDVKGSRTQFEFNFDIIFKDAWVLAKGMYLNTNLYFEDIKQSAKQKNQIASLEKGTVIRNASILAPGTKQQLKYVPTFKNRIPHAVMTTGAATVNDYTNEYYMSARTSRFAEWDHQCGAIIVEVESEKIFHFRQIQAAEDGSFTDVDMTYHSDGTMTRAKDSILVMGDSHAGMEDTKLVEAVVGSLMSKCNISELVLHDLCNSAACSHHEANDTIILAQRAVDNTNSMMNEIRKVSRYLDNLSRLNSNLHVTVVNSNHDGHIERAVRELRCVAGRDSLNQPILFDLWLQLVNKTVTNPLKYLVEKYTQLTNPHKIKWLELDESYERYGTELGLHGHLGANGARGSLKTFENAVGNAVVGHSHSGAILCNIFQVGTTSEMDMGYNKGLSSWTRTCCLVHADGTKQLVNFIPVNGEYHYTV